MKNKCRNLKQNFILLVVLLLILMSVLTACGIEGNTNRGHYDLDVINHTSDFYVNDFAGLFSEEEKNDLMAKAVSLDEEYSGIQVVITTVESLDSTVVGYEYVVEDENGNRVDDSEVKLSSIEPKFTIEQVAYSMYSEYGIGQDDMGILILFSAGDRMVRIETGRQMQFYITDSVSGRILDDYGMEYFVEDKFAEGLVSVQNAVINEIKSKVSPDWLETSKQSGGKEAQNATVAPVLGNAEEISGENAGNITEENKEKSSGNGLLWGFFGSIVAACAALVAFISQKFKGKSEKESLEKLRQEEIERMQSNFQFQLAQNGRDYEEKLFSLKADSQRVIQEKEKRIRSLERELQEANSQISTLKKGLEDMTDIFNRAQRLHPEYNFNEEVRRMVEDEYKAAAKKIDCDLAEVLTISADKDNYDVFNRALLLFDSTQPEVKKYVTSDRGAIEKLYNEAIRLKQEYDRAQKEMRDRAAAKEAYDKIKKTCDNNSVGNHQNYATLSAALAIVTGLSAAEKSFFPDRNLLSKLERLYSDAERDYNNYESARKAESNVRSIIGGMYSADEDDRDKLERARRYYRSLSEPQKAYFSAELLRKLKKLIDEADEDHRRENRRREQQAAARRASQLRSSSSSSHHHSSFSGHGGRPSGGGASRRF